MMDLNIITYPMPMYCDNENNVIVSILWFCFHGFVSDFMFCDLFEEIIYFILSKMCFFQKKKKPLLWKKNNLILYIYAF
jgi:hypothetical protein